MGRLLDNGVLIPIVDGNFVSLWHVFLERADYKIGCDFVCRINEPELRTLWTGDYNTENALGGIPESTRQMT